MVASYIITAVALMGAASAAPAQTYSPKPGDSPAPLRVVGTDLCIDNAHACTDIGNPINGWRCEGPIPKKQGWFRDGNKFRLAGVEDRCIGVTWQDTLVLASCTENDDDIKTIEFAFNKDNKPGSTPQEGTYMCIAGSAVPGRLVRATCVKAPYSGYQIQLKDEEAKAGSHTPISWEDPAAAVYHDPKAPYYPYPV